MGAMGDNTVRLCFGLGPGSGATGLFDSLCLASGLSCWARWRARMSILAAYSASQAVAVGRFMSVSVVSSAEHLVAFLTGIGLPRHRWILQVGFPMPGQVSLLCKFFGASLAGEHGRGLSKTECQ
jgi:hypothetical protein